MHEISRVSVPFIFSCEVQQVDYFAKEDGYIAIIRLDDLRLLSKRDSEFATFFYK